MRENNQISSSAMELTKAENGSCGQNVVGHLLLFFFFFLKLHETFLKLKGTEQHIDSQEFKLNNSTIQFLKRKSEIQLKPFRFENWKKEQA